MRADGDHGPAAQATVARREPGGLGWHRPGPPAAATGRGCGGSPPQRGVRQPVQVDGGQVGQQLVELAERLGASALSMRSLNSSAVSRPAAWCSRSSAVDAVAVRVRGADPRVTRHRAPSSRQPPRPPPGRRRPSLLASRCLPPSLADGAWPPPLGWARAARPPTPPSSAVSTQGPSAVIATVCSKCAAQLPSAVTTVQPSSSSRCPGRRASASARWPAPCPASSRGPRPGRP